MSLVPALRLAATLWLVAAADAAETRPAADKNDAPLLIQQGRKYLGFGSTNEAEAKWRAALKLDPGNIYARQYLEAIGRTNWVPEKPAVPSVPITPANLVDTSEARQKIYAKLDSIRFDSVAYDGLPLSEVIKTIDRDTLNRDPEKKGINFLLSTTADPQPAAGPTIDPQTGLPVATVPAAENELEATFIRISPPQKDITLHQLLDILVLVADRPIKYSVTDFGILITLRGEQPITLYTRWYKVDPNTFVNGLQGVVNQGFDASFQQTRKGSAQSAGVNAAPPRSGPTPTRQAQGEIEYTTVQTSQDAVITRIKNEFFRVGVDLSMPKSVVFNDRLGMLMIRTSLADFKILEQTIRRVHSLPSEPGIEGTISTPDNSAPPQIPQPKK